MRVEDIASQIAQEIVAKNTSIPVPVTISNRHVHLDEKTRLTLFGGKPLTVRSFLVQPGEFAAEEVVKVIGPKGHFDAVRVVGPDRASCQLEISFGDCYNLGVEPIIRDSGNLEGSPGIFLVGPTGMVEMKQGVIVARRHIHMIPSDAKRYGIVDSQIVRIRFPSGIRKGILGDVIVRVNENYALECHLDVEEANALGVKNNDTVFLEIGGI